MRIDLQDRRFRIAVGSAGFLALVAWLVPPTTPQSQPSPLRAFANVDPHLDDAAAVKRNHRTTIWSADTWKRWYAGEARAPSAQAVPAIPAVTIEKPAARPQAQRRQRGSDVDSGRWDDRDWEESEGDRRRWLDERDSDRMAAQEERLWEREQARRDREEYRAWQQRQREAEWRARPYPDDDPYYDEE